MLGGSNRLMREDICLFMGMPSRNGLLDYRIVEQRTQLQKQVKYLAATVNICSLLAFNFNKILATALTYRDNKPEKWPSGVTHMLLWHDDIIPHGTTWFLDLLGEMERFNLKAISAHVSMRDNSGCLSTGYDPPGENPDPIRYHVGEKPGTITSREIPLLINTGIMLIDIRDPWVNNFCFRMNDGIRHEDGRYYAICCSEDWFASRWMRLNDIPFGATDKVKTSHIGETVYNNFLPETTWQPQP